MKYIEIPFSRPQRLSFYLATEEYVARYRKEDDCFFMWQVAPTVIIGRNQLLEAEVNLDFCRKRRIDVVRRKSGGGCVYADFSNVMFSYINSGQSVTYTFDKYIQLVVSVLRQMGIPAETSGRNDILIEGKKVSGNAFYHIPGRNIVHGTMLYDTDIENMVRSITPNEQKMISKGVKSVSQRITFLKNYTRMSLEEFKHYVKENLCQSKISLSLEEIRKIREIELEYTDRHYFIGNNPQYALIRKGRIDGCGDLECRIELKDEKVVSMSLNGDYFPIGDLDGDFLPAFQGALYEKRVFETLLGEKNPELYIKGLTTDALMHILFD